MDCRGYRAKISSYLNDELTAAERVSFDRHRAECSDCRGQLALARALAEELDQLPLEALPIDYNETLKARLAAANQTEDRGNLLDFIRRRQKWLIGLAACVVLVFSLPLLLDFSVEPTETIAEDLLDNEAKSDVPLVEPGGEYELVDSDRATSLADSDVSPAVRDDLQQRKLIKRGSVDLAVANYDLLLEGVDALLADSGGYIKSSHVGIAQRQVGNRNVDYRQGNLTLCIPSDQFEMVYRRVLTLGEVRFHEQVTEDISNAYRDTVSAVKNLEVRETALRDIMKRATTVDEIITVEAELSRVRAEIDQLTGDLQQWDRLVDMSTINLTIQERVDGGAVIQSFDDDILKRASRAFRANANRLIDLLEVLFVGIIGILPLLLPVVAIAVIVGVVVKVIRRKTR